MNTNYAIVIFDTIAAALYFGALLWAVRRSGPRRYLFFLKALVMAYFLVLAAQVLSGTTSAFTLRLYRPMLGVLFLLQFLSIYVDTRRRR